VFFRRGVVLDAHAHQGLDFTPGEREHAGRIGFRQFEIAPRGFQIETAKLLAQQERVQRWGLIQHLQRLQIAARRVDRDPERLEQRLLELALTDKHKARAKAQIACIDRYHHLRRRSAQRGELVGLAAPEPMLDDDRSVQRLVLEHRRGCVLGRITIQLPDRAQIEHPRCRGAIFKMGEISDGLVGHAEIPWVALFASAGQRPNGAMTAKYKLHARSL